VRDILNSRIKKFEITTLYLSAVIALIAEFYLVVYLLIESFDYWDWDLFLLLTCSLLVPLIAGLAFVVVILRKRIPHHITSVIYMELAWIVNTIFCVTMFWEDGLDIGAWVAAFAGAIYLVDIILLTRRGLREAANKELSTTNLH